MHAWVYLVLLASDYVGGVIFLELGFLASASESTTVVDLLHGLPLQLGPPFLVPVHLLQNPQRQLVVTLLQTGPVAAILILDLALLFEAHIEAEGIFGTIHVLVLLLVLI